MSRLVARAENWERTYKALENVNLAAFDYSTIKQSLLDYMKLHYAEVFNDFIESSELIAIIEAFAYVGELLAYRFDVNARENLLPVAQRRESILRLVNGISYRVTRPIPARGLIKLTSITTTESIIDANGNNLANRTIRWNDPMNGNWKSQFITILDRILDQNFGSVAPKDRFQIQNQLFELYRMDYVPLVNTVVPFTAFVDGRNIPMEIVPIKYDESVGITERRPALSETLSILYGTDGLGDSSPTTGFFLYVKQGTIQRVRANFNGTTPNISFTLPYSNINDTDIWVNQVDPNTNEIIEDTLAASPKPTTQKKGEWVEVDMAHAENVIFNTNPFRNKYEVETLSDNRVRVNFGDGNFANIPSGTFDIWARSSVNERISIPQSSISNQSTTINYIDMFGRTQTITITFSLTGPLQNNSEAESDEHIRLTAPAVYYSQDRMVNAEDHNVFPLKDPSILKLRTINRTFVGDSRYVKWFDASSTYDNVSIFSNDGAIYLEESNNITQTLPTSIDVIIDQQVEPILSSVDIFMALTTAGVDNTLIRRYFNTNERARLITALSPPPSPDTISLFYDLDTNEWYAHKSQELPNVSYPAPLNYSLIVVDLGKQYPGTVTTQWTSKHYVLHSPTTQFWTDNDGDNIINFNTLANVYDNISIIQANINSNRQTLLSEDWKFKALGRETIQTGPNKGLLNPNAVGIMPINNYGFPDYTDPYDTGPLKYGLKEILIPKLEISTPVDNMTVTLPIYYISSTILGTSDIVVKSDDGTLVDFVEIVNGEQIGNAITLVNLTPSQLLNPLTIQINEYVYFRRETLSDGWYMLPNEYQTLRTYVLDHIADADLVSRKIGRYDLNFDWRHYTSQYHLVDPSPTNIHDMYIITKGYYDDFRRWLNNNGTRLPQTPTPFELRTSYDYLLDNKMMSDTIIMHPGKFKLLFGPRALPQLQGQFLVIRSDASTLTDNQIKNRIVSITRSYFDVTNWEFGETFYFSELSAAIHAQLSHDINSIVFVPSTADHYFGDGYEVMSMEDEVFYSDITPDGIEFVRAYTPTNLKQRPYKLF